MKTTLSSTATAWIAAAVLIATPPAPAQESKAKAPPVIAVKAARLFDGKADALQANGVVLVQGPKILAVGTDLSIPAGAEVIDLGDATLSPGFIDAHTHLTGESTDDWKQGFVDNFRREVRREGDRVHGVRAKGAGGRLHDRARRGERRPARREPAQRDRPGAGPRPPDAGLRSTGWGRAAATPTRPGCGTTSSRSSGRPRGSPTGRKGSARRSASR